MLDFLPRTAMEDLVAWKDAPLRKPLLLNGTRQVGKTSLVNHFGKTYFENFAYINLDEYEDNETLFRDFNLDRILNTFEFICDTHIIAGKTLLFIDEIQEYPPAITLLKYFCERKPELHVIASGSYLGIKLRKHTGFPAGKVNRMTLHPMTFLEFLDACDESRLKKALQTADESIITTFDNQLNHYLALYFIIGGMPGIVSAYTQGTTISQIRAQQEDLMNDFRDTLAKHVPDTDIMQVLRVWDQAAVHLGREGRRLIASDLHTGARMKHYQSALQWLADAGFINFIYKVNNLAIPLDAYTEYTYVKPYALDLGLLGAQLQIDAALIVNPTQVFNQYKGIMCEQFIIQELFAQSNQMPHYMLEYKPNFELDAVYSEKGRVYAFEVKSSVNVRSKSLRHAHDVYPDLKCVRFSPRGFEQQDWMINCPLYAVSVPELWQ